MNMFLSILFLLKIIRSCVCTTNDDHLYNEFFFNSLANQKLAFSVNSKNLTSKAIQVRKQMDCVFSCVSISWCRSINYKIASEISGLHECELLSIDKLDRALTQDEKFAYLSIKNPCEKEPCLHGGTCNVEYNRRDYRCQCTPGYTGEKCQNDINECLGSPGCHSNAKCENTAGSYSCVCNSGYDGDGRTCSPVSWTEYTPYMCGNGRVLLQSQKTKEECKQLCVGNAGCIAVEWWGTGSRYCYKCPDPQGRRSYTNTKDGAYPPYVIIKP